MASELIKQLLEAGVHFGHQKKRWNPKMKKFIFGERSGIYVIDLEKTEECLNAARDFLVELASKGENLKDFTYGFIPFLVLVGFMTALIIAQPDLSTAIVIFSTAVVMFFVG